MENYIKTRNVVSNVLAQSGLSKPEMCGVLSECLAEVRDAMVSEAIGENFQLREQLVKASLKNPVEVEESGT